MIQQTTNTLQNETDFLQQIATLKQEEKPHGLLWAEHLKTLSPTFPNGTPFALRADIVRQKRKKTQIRLSLVVPINLFPFILSLPTEKDISVMFDIDSQPDMLYPNETYLQAYLLTRGFFLQYCDRFWGDYGINCANNQTHALHFWTKGYLSFMAENQCKKGDLYLAINAIFCLEKKPNRDYARHWSKLTQAQFQTLNKNVQKLILEHIEKRR